MKKVGKVLCKFSELHSEQNLCLLTFFKDSVSSEKPSPDYLSEDSDESVLAEM
jgi:hypothetical protein